jgi:hypothetical protein
MVDPVLNPPLPARLASVFRSLRRGRHLSRGDGADFFDLDRNQAEYERLLAGLGYVLRRHPQGFYYLEGPGAMRAERVRSAVVFLLIMFQDLEERKFQSGDRSWEKTLLTRAFRVAELPHFHTAQRRAMMSAVDVGEAELGRVLALLERLGVARLLPEGQFEFLPPVHRFIDLCVKYAADETWPERAGHALPSVQIEQGGDDGVEEDEQ